MHLSFTSLEYIAMILLQKKTFNTVHIYVLKCDPQAYPERAGIVYCYSLYFINYYCYTSLPVRVVLSNAKPTQNGEVLIQPSLNCKIFQLYL